MTLYRLSTPYRWETWGARTEFDPYSRLAGRPINGSTGSYGAIPPHLTDIARGMSLLINGNTVTEIQTPSQDQLAAADQYFLGGTINFVNQETANILIAAGYSAFLEPV